MSRKIIGVTVGTPTPRANLKQTDPRKADYVKGKDIIPEKVSQLENDAGYLTDSALPEVVNTALALAKESGEFDGKDGVSPEIRISQSAPNWEGRKTTTISYLDERVDNGDGTFTDSWTAYKVTDGKHGARWAEDERNLLISILRNTEHTTDQTSNIDALADYLAAHPTYGSGSSDGGASNSGTAGSGVNGGYYTPVVTQPDANTMKIAYVPSKDDMPEVAAKLINLLSGKDGAPGKDGDDYVLTDADKAEIAEQAAQLVDVPGGGGFVASDNPPEDTSLLWVDTDDNSGSDGGITDDHINALIDAKLGVIENASY